jgi:tetratricopeptide (TPR) repeat protein/tRNA A-37 threonylcarbamoyl transferase component Bud32
METCFTRKLETMIGKRILHYKILEKLGEGGMAVVYRAEDTKLHRQVALKFLPAAALERKEDRARFVAEARAAAALDHPNICTVHEINEADGQLFISMAFVEGRDVKEIVDADGPMKILRAARIAVQIAEGLAAAHEKGIVHRDIKSANIMVTPRDQAKIMDFGLAYRAIGDRTDAGAATLGTVAYGSPEQLGGGTADHRTDIWSFGVTLYEMLTGELPFKGDYESAIIYSVLNESPKPPRAVRSDIPEDLERIVMKALSKKPEDRYPSAESMLEELVQARHAVDPTISKALAAGGAGERGVAGWTRRLMITAGVYLGCTWLVGRVAELIVGNLQLSPYIVQITTVGMLSFLPAVLLIAFLTAKGGPGRWGKPGWIGVPVNVLASVALLLVMFSGKDIGAVTKKVEVTNEEGETIERVIPTGSFRKKFAMYLFDDQTGEPDGDWLQYAVPMLIEYDVLQDPFLQARSPFETTSLNRIKEAGFNSWNGVPLALKRKIADEAHMDHFVTGSIDHAGDEKVVTVQVYATKSGKRVSENTYRGTDVFEMVDDISKDLMHSVEVPQWHLDGAPDLPVAEMVTNSENAIRELALARKAMALDSDWAGAAEHLEAATDADSSLAFAYFQKFYVYRKSDQIEKSDAALEAALRHSYKVPERIRFIIKANYYFVRQQPDKVLAVANMMTELYPDDVLGYEVKAEVHTLRNETDAAIETYDRIIELDPFQYDHLKTAAKLRERKGDYEGALEYYRRYAELNPDDPSSFQEIGDAYREMGEFEEAKKNYDRALLMEPERVSLLVDAARIDLTLGRFDTARQQFQNALGVSRASSDSINVYTALEDYYEIRGEFRKAIESMWKRYATMQHTVSPLEVYTGQLGDMNRYVHAGRPDDAFLAMKEIESNVTAAPFNKVISFGYVDIYIAQEDPDNAEANMAGIEDYIQSLGLELLRPVCDYSWGRIHELRGNYDDAIAAYGKVLQNDPTDYGSNLGTGRCYRKQGDYRRAAVHLEKVAKQRPFDGPANYELALLYHATGRYREANEHLDRTLEIWSNADPTYKAAARARAAKREWQAASNM